MYGNRFTPKLDDGERGSDSCRMLVLIILYKVPYHNIILVHCTNNGPQVYGTIICTLISTRDETRYDCKSEKAPVVNVKDDCDVSTTITPTYVYGNTSIVRILGVLPLSFIYLCLGIRTRIQFSNAVFCFLFFQVSERFWSSCKLFSPFHPL